jgi:hypothetical protein
MTLKKQKKLIFVKAVTRNRANVWPGHIEKKLAEMAQIYLTPPPTSTYVESLFSKTGDILTNETNRLNPENAK